MKFSRMMLMANSKRRDGEGRYNEYGENRYNEYGEDRRYPMEDRYGSARGGYEADDRFRDRRGREHYDNGRYAPQNRGDSWVGSEYNEPQGRYEMMHYRPQPYYNGDYGRTRDSRPMNKIGFEIGGEMERFPREFDEDFRADEMSRRYGGERVRGYSAVSEVRPMDRQTADEWVSEMKNADGTTGPHWSFEQAKQVMTQRKIDCDPVQFFAAMNAVYSDFYNVAKKHGVNNIEFFADLAKAWLDDKDAVPDKAAAYYQYVVKH